LVGEVILMAIDKTIIVLGEGDLFFSPFEPGTTQGDGEEYFGNTTDISISRDVSKLDRFTSYGGQQISLSPIILRESASLDITTDHLAMSNVARWFGMISEDSDVLAGAGTYFESFTARLGRFYQLGQTVTPQGVRAIENVQVSVGGTAVDPATNFEVDNASGRIQILRNAASITDGQTFVASFEWRTQSRGVVTPGLVEVLGALRFVSANRFGPNKNYFFPCVALSSSGGLDLKDSNWQSLRFAAEVRRLNPATELYYVDEVFSTSTTLGEQQVIDLVGDDGPFAIDDLGEFFVDDAGNYYVLPA
jgi:hypothetical protein